MLLMIIKKVKYNKKITIKRGIVTADYIIKALIIRALSDR